MWEQKDLGCALTCCVSDPKRGVEDEVCTCIYGEKVGLLKKNSGTNQSVRFASLFVISCTVILLCFKHHIRAKLAFPGESPPGGAVKLRRHGQECDYKLTV